MIYFLRLGENFYHFLFLVYFQFFQHVSSQRINIVRKYGSSLHKFSFSLRAAAQLRELKKLISITEELIAALEPLRFGPPVTHVYNPLVYAREPHSRYIKRYARRRCEIVRFPPKSGIRDISQSTPPEKATSTLPMSASTSRSRPIGSPSARVPKPEACVAIRSSMTTI